jgi:hypothetical protein
MVRETINNGLALTFESPDVEGGSGKPRTVNSFAADVARLVEAAGNQFRLKQVTFQHSVTFRLIPEDAEAALRALEAIEVADDDLPVGETMAGAAELEAVAAAIELTNVLALPADEALPAAVKVRPALAEAYVHLAKTLDDKQASLRVGDPDAPAAEVTRDKAHAIVEIAENPVPAPPAEIEIRGILSAADAKAATFKIELDEDFPRPPGMAPQTRYVEGEYNSASREAVEKYSLWNSRVVATVIAKRAQYPTRLQPTITGYSFQSIRPFGN